MRVSLVSELYQESIDNSSFPVVSDFIIFIFYLSK